MTDKEKENRVMRLVNAVKERNPRMASGNLRGIRYGRRVVWKRCGK